MIEEGTNQVNRSHKRQMTILVTTKIQRNTYNETYVG